MKPINLIAFVTLALSAAPAFAQEQVVTERKDSLEATVKVARKQSNYLSKGKDLRTEVISSAGLCKMACCNLAESFENSASVTVGYADAVTGARQIRLLGQSGTYTQMLDENRPVMRGISSPFQLTYVPSQWLESIQIGKGVPSVINGVESMTGQINMEYRKPTDEKPFFLQASVMDDTKADLNVVSSLQLDEAGRWSTVLLGHVDADFMDMDMNQDGFLDSPRTKQISFGNRWLYYGDSGTQVRWGVNGVLDRREGGRSTWFEDPWRTKINNDVIDGYLKIGVPLNEDNTRNIAMVADYNFQNMNSVFGMTIYNAGQHSAFVNLLYQDQALEHFHYTLGLSHMADYYDEMYWRMMYVYGSGSDLLKEEPLGSGTLLGDTGAFGEFTFLDGDRFTAVVGLRGDYYSGVGVKMTPRVTLKWMPHESIVLRANGGQGIRWSNPVIDNIGILSTGKDISGLAGPDHSLIHPLEQSWTFGANATWYVPFDKSGKTYLSADFFRTQFTDQLLVDNTSTAIYLYMMDTIEGAQSYTNNYQLDFSTEPFEGFTVTLTGRYTDARQTLKHQADDVKPMTSRYKGVLNLQYAAPLNKWIFDATASINGPCKVWDFMKTLDPIYESGYTPVYPLIYLQATKRFKGVDIYAGVENLTGYTQPNPIIRYENPWARDFDASCIWGPLMGAKFYAGIRVTIWKTV